MKLRSLRFCIFGFLAVAIAFATRAYAQELTLEGQTGGFLTPTAYVVYSEKGHVLSHPSVGYHFVNASSVIGYVQTASVVEGFANRAEVGYTRSFHSNGNSPSFSSLWAYDGMNIVSGKVVLVKDGQGSPATPGIAVGGIVRTGDHFVSGALNKELTGVDKGYTNGDVYIAATKTWIKPPVPFLINAGWKATNGEIFGLGGQSTRFMGRFFGGLGVPLPFFFKTAIVPSAGFTQEPPQVKNLSNPYVLVGGKAHMPTTLDYAVRITQVEKPHFAFDLGVGQVANTIGQMNVPTGLANPPYVQVPVSLQARHVVGMGISYRY